MNPIDDLTSYLDVHQSTMVLIHHRAYILPVGLEPFVTHVFLFKMKTVKLHPHLVALFSLRFQVSFRSHILCSIYTNLVGGFKHFLFFHNIWDNPSQLTNTFQEGQVYHQPERLIEVPKNSHDSTPCIHVYDHLSKIVVQKFSIGC